tara:strand:- start:391 stop:843 length:453 start_codon:yes stop_codon:yes gene_type:complete
MSEQNEIECGITGITPEESSWPMPVGPSDDEELDGLPIGWSKLVFLRRRYNPEWLRIQMAKQAMVEGILQQFGADGTEVTAAQKDQIMIQVRASLHALERDTPVYEVIEESLFISDSADVIGEFNAMREALGLAVVGADESGEEVSSPVG